MGVLRSTQPIALCAAVLVTSAAQAMEPLPPPETPPESAAVDEPKLDESKLLHFDDRRLGLGLRLGFGTTVGLAGWVLEYDLSDRVNVGIGVGTNLLGPVGEAHVRLRPAVARTSRGNAAHAFTVEGAFSESKYDGSLYDNLGLMGMTDCSVQHPACNRPPTVAAWMSWVQAEIGWEYRARSGFSLRTSTGYAFALKTPEWHCGADSTGCGRSSRPMSFVGTATLTIGYVF